MAGYKRSHESSFKLKAMNHIQFAQDGHRFGVSLDLAVANTYV